jgi:DeoR family glycerol-3-phosphate regulon repressor
MPGDERRSADPMQALLAQSLPVRAIPEQAIPEQALPAQALGARRQHRLDRIAAVVIAGGYATIEELAAVLGVTPQTIRRDLAALAAAGRLRRTHGGAAAAGPSAVTPPAHASAGRAGALGRIASAIAALIPDGAAVFLDTGPTCEAVAEALVARRQLSVVTYNLRIAARLADCTDFVVALTGGFVRNADGSVFRDGADDFLRRFRFDVAVVSADAVDADGTLAGDDHHAATLVRAAVERARMVVLAADSSAFGRSALVYLGHLREVAALVTDAPPPDEVAATLDEAGTRLHVAGEG